MSKIGLRLSCFLIIGCMIPTSSWGQEKLTQDQQEFFENNIRPSLVKYCYECHSEASGKTRGGLLVDTRDGLLLGGDSGAAIEPGSIDESVLWGAITWQDYKMPPKTKMPEEVIQHFKKWIEMGAPDPRVREKIVVSSKVDIAEGKKHWAFQKPTKPTKSSIDEYVTDKLQQSNLTAVEKADALTLLRRLNFDLIGLPPTVDEARSFFDAWKVDSNSAIESKVDELLSRPQFGERWGRHWLDVARYAESTGKDVNFTYPHAWRYRDYVIDSLNADKPYDQFVKEQIAGDLLPVKTDEDWQKNLIATGFLALGTKGLNERNPRTFRMDVIDEQIDTMSQSILGVTVACARCHDHKFDPIPTTDYYALAGIFLSTETYYGTANGLQNRRASDLIMLPIEDNVSLARDYSEAEIKEMRERIVELQTESRSLRLASQRDGAQVDQRRFIAMRNQISRLEAALKTVDASGKPKTYAMGVQDANYPTNARVLVRGDVEKQAQEVERGFLQVLSDVPTGSISSKKSGRIELAEFLTSKENPLTARVMVNRIWLHLFGEPLMASPNNWGLTGQTPTNPELLDYLAVRFMEKNWSIKSMIREIVLSDTYQRSSSFNQANYDIDPDNNLLWRANPRQLDAESLRDAILLVSGQLNYDRKLGSEIAMLGDKRVGREVSEATVNKPDNHRSVYLPVVRDLLPEALDTFDFADPTSSNEKRDSTNVPSQALYMMNNQFVIEQSRAMAKELLEEHKEQKDQIRWAFLTAYSRPPESEEIAASVRFFRAFKPSTASASSQVSTRGSFGNARRRPLFSRTPTPVDSPELQKLAAFCQSLIASAEFRILN